MYLNSVQLIRYMYMDSIRLVRSMYMDSVQILRFMYILIIKTNRCTKFSISFWNKALHVSDSFSVHHQESSTVYTAMVYIIQVLLTACWQNQNGIDVY